MKVSTEFDAITQKNVDEWINGNYDNDTKEEVKKLLRDNPREALDAFYTNLTFGTGGLRGIMGVGTNRMNAYTVRAATQGLANYINMQPKVANGSPTSNSQSKEANGHSVLIGYDSRINSRIFAEESAKVLAGNGIRVYLFEDIRPTPFVSFGCRFKKCISAIMLTASHNPAIYNGYKVYWDDGGQILPPHDTKIIEQVNLIKDPSQVKMIGNLHHPLIEWVGSGIDDAYFAATAPLQNNQKENQQFGSTLKVVYTSLHGTGIAVMPKALSNWGFTNLTLVEKQVIPDGNFPTAPYPNPEEKAALQMGIAKLLESNGDLLIATDPDADRVGVVVMHRGKEFILTGNQIAALCLDHICSALDKQGRMPPKAAFVKTIVTTELFKAVAEFYQKPCFNVLTGFKYIAQKIREWEKDPKNGLQFVFGGEESYGYLLGTQVRDKDAIIMSQLICEMALEAKRHGKTLVDLLEILYIRHGAYFETLLSVNFEESKEGKEKMAAGIKKLQDSPPKSLCGIPVASLEDYQRSIKTDLKTGKTEPLTLPKSDVLLFWLEDHSKVIIRPSGTEPKIKIYCGVRENPAPTILDALKKGENKAKKLVEDLKNHLST